MKKSLWAVGVLVVIAIILFLVFGHKRSPSPIPVVDQSVAVGTTSPIVVTSLHTDVSLKENNEIDFRDIGVAATTTPGSRLKTSSTGRALIESSAAHKTLVDYNSEVVLADSSAAEKKTSIQLVAGAVWSRLEKVFESGEYYEIKTSNAVAVVRGTSFGVWYSGGVTTLVVTSGAVSFSAVDPLTGEVVSGSEVIVTAGQKAIWNGSGVIKVTSITQKDKQFEWYIYNNPTDTTSTPTPSPVSPTPISSPNPTPAPTPVTPTPTPTTANIIPTISSMLPTSVYANSGSLVTLKGSGFLRVKSLVVGRNSIPNFRTVDDTKIQFAVDGLSTGDYTVTIIDLDNHIVDAPTQLSITAAPPPPPAPAPTPTPTTNILYPAGQ